MERPNSQQFESSIHCQDLIDYADDQSTTNVCSTTVHSPVENPATVHSLTNVNSPTNVHSPATVESLTNTHSLNNIDSSSTTAYSAECPDGPATVHSPATVDRDSPTTVDFLSNVDGPIPVHSPATTTVHSLNNLTTVHSLTNVQSPTSCMPKSKIHCFYFIIILVYLIGTSTIQIEVTAPCNILNGDKILLEYNPILMDCTLKVHQAGHRPPATTRLDCPVKQCYTCNLKKLSNHLIQVHGISNKAKRKKLLQKAKRVSI